MASIYENIALISACKTAIRGAVNAKGGALSADAPMSAYAPAVESLQTGGAGGVIADPNGYAALVGGRLADVSINNGFEVLGASASVENISCSFYFRIDSGASADTVNISNNCSAFIGCDSTGNAANGGASVGILNMISSGSAVVAGNIGSALIGPFATAAASQGASIGSACVSGGWLSCNDATCSTLEVLSGGSASFYNTAFSSARVSGGYAYINGGSGNSLDILSGQCGISGAYVAAYANSDTTMQQTIDGGVLIDSLLNNGSIAINGSSNSVGVLENNSSMILSSGAVSASSMTNTGFFECMGEFNCSALAAGGETCILGAGSVIAAQVTGLMSANMEISSCSVAPGGSATFNAVCSSLTVSSGGSVQIYGSALSLVVSSGGAADIYGSAQIVSAQSDLSGIIIRDGAIVTYI